MLEGANVLGAFDLSESEIDLLGRAFALVGESTGFDGERIFGALRRGHPLGEALSLSPKIIDAMYACAYQWLMVGQPAKAAPLLRALVMIDPLRADFWIGFGASVRQTDPEDARAAFTAAARLRPDWALPKFHLLALAVSQRDWEAAETALSAYTHAGDGDLPPAVVREATRLASVLPAKREEATRAGKSCASG